MAKVIVEDWPDKFVFNKPAAFKAYQFGTASSNMEVAHCFDLAIINI